MLTCSRFILVSTSFAMAVLIGFPSYDDVCYNVTRVEKASLDVISASDPVYINFCTLKGCAFDVSTCSIKCPIGYMLDEIGCPKSCICGDQGFVEGDIAFSSHDIPFLFKMLYGSGKITNVFSLHDFEGYFKVATWGIGENVLVPVSMDSSFGNETLKFVKAMMNTISMRTCIKFKRYENDLDFVHIQPSSFCSATVGRKPGKNTISVNKHCTGVAGLVHLMMHTLGLYHEQDHNSRDDYVTIHWDNIEPNAMQYFMKFTEDPWSDLDVDYDVLSILHFPSMVFAKQSGKETITGKNNRKVRGENIQDLHAGIQQSDVKKLNALYRCPGFEEKNNSSFWSSWTEWEYVESYSECVRNRTCMKGPSGAVGNGVCVDSTGHAARLEIVKTPICDEAITTKAVKHNIAKRQFVKLGFASSSSIFRGLCKNGVVLVGKFNLDDISDVVCHNDDGYLRLFVGSNSVPYYNAVYWEGPTPLCKYASADRKLFATDLNGDGFDDLFCQRKSGVIEIIFLKNGIFEDSLDWSGLLDKCTLVIDVVDMNSDGKSDIVCADTNTAVSVKIFPNRL